jgi:hypothetical protein
VVRFRDRWWCDLGISGGAIVRMREVRNKFLFFVMRRFF